MVAMHSTEHTFSYGRNIFLNKSYKVYDLGTGISRATWQEFTINTLLRYNFTIQNLFSVSLGGLAEMYHKNCVSITRLLPSSDSVLNLNINFLLYSQNETVREPHSTFTTCQGRSTIILSEPKYRFWTWVFISDIFTGSYSYSRKYGFMIIPVTLNHLHSKSWGVLRLPWFLSRWFTFQWFSRNEKINHFHESYNLYLMMKISSWKSHNNDITCFDWCLPIKQLSI